MTWGAVPWVVLGELLPMSIKGLESSLATGGTWLADALITMFMPSWINNFNIGVIFLAFSVFDIITYFIVRREVIETKGRTQYEITELNKQRYSKVQATLE